MDSSNNNDKNKAQDKKIINLDNYKYVSNNEQFRAKQEKMNELLGSEDFGGNNTRRVTRKHLLIKNNKTSSEKVFISFHDFCFQS